MLRLDSAACLEAVDARQVDVHQNQVRVQASRGQDRVFARPGLAHYLEALRHRHDLVRRNAKRLLVVDDQHLHCHASIAG